MLRKIVRDLRDLSEQSGTFLNIELVLYHRDLAVLFSRLHMWL